MPRLRIDNQSVEVPDGATILDAAEAIGITIPTLCFLKSRTPSTSCMVCLVAVEGRSAMLPACATVADDGMVVHSETDTVRAARQAALELLLSDHLGDCMGPCQIACPAGMNIPLMIRQIAAGELREAIATVKRDIALPAVLGRICPAPCEKVCRRGQIDDAVSVCLLKQFVADVDLAEDMPFLPPHVPDSGKTVAVVGAGPAGLAAAMHLRQFGHRCTVLDDQASPGGALRNAIGEGHLPAAVLDAEIEVIRRLGAEFRTGVRVGRDIALDELRRDFDAVLLATGKLEDADVEALGVRGAAKDILADRATFRTHSADVFATGNAIRANNKMAVRALADGKEAAFCIDQFLRSNTPAALPRPFNTRIGKLREEEGARFLAGASRAARVEPAGDRQVGFDRDEARAEAVRCLHCDCRKADACKLRDWSQAYHASAGRFKDDRRTFEAHAEHAEVIYEPGKCIDCGLCVQIASACAEPLGLTFVGRGFDVRVAVPFDDSLADALQRAAAECIAACPTGALARKDS